MNSCIFLVLRQYRSLIIIILTLIVLAPLLFLWDSKESRAAFVVLLMAVLWMTEALPLPVTSLLPVALFPIMGIMTSGQTCTAYMKESNMVFFGGLVMALATEHSNLHRRIALRVLLICGTNPKWLMLGFMSITMFLSMWISNIAATAMLVPIVNAVVEQIFKKDDEEEVHVQEGLPLITITEELEDQIAVEVKSPETTATQEDLRMIRLIMQVSVAYAASIGGTGTLIGSTPQLVLKGTIEERYPEVRGLSFATWMSINIPCVIINAGATWLWLTYLASSSFKKSSSLTSGDVSTMIATKYKELGRVTFQESIVMTAFVLLVSIWFFKDPQFIPGWSAAFPYKVGDSAAILLLVLLLFIVPAKPLFSRKDSAVEKTPLVTWDLIQKKFPWGLLFLLGGGFALSDGSKASGLSSWLGLQLSNCGLHTLPRFALLIFTCCLTGAITEVASNTATASVVLPVLAQLSETMNLNPLYLTMPASVACSYAFLLPAASPTNAIVYTSAGMRTLDMVKTGLLVKVICILVMCAVMESLGDVMLDIHTFPEWAGSSTNSTKSMNPR